MEADSGQAISIWMATAETPERPPLSGDANADVCVVGAGIAGMTTAYLLAREGRSVIVLDDGRIGGGMTERTTAHLSNAIDDRYSRIERMHGGEGARLAAESHTAAIDMIEKIVREEEIDCDFERVDGYLFLPPGDSTDILEQEMKAAHRAGLTDVEQVERAPIAGHDTGPCLRFPRQAQFHPLKYLTGLSRAIERDGGKIFTGTHVSDVKGGESARIETEGGYSVTAGAAVIATNAPINDIVTIHTKQAPYTSYVIGARIPRGSVTRALYWDTADPYHYVRIFSGADGDHDVLIVGGEDHKTGQADDSGERFARLEAWARDLTPSPLSMNLTPSPLSMNGEGDHIEFRWSGQVMEPVDGVAFIGRNPGDSPNIYIATGDSGMGMTHGTIAGILLTDLIAGRENPWAKLYDPSRKSFTAPLEWARENINVAGQYLEDYLSGGDVESPDTIAPGEGAIIRRGVAKIAVYRDDKGKLHQRSAVCRHLGCIVGWNSLEKTWDCPCHGARYSAYGRVINGPANSDLEPIEES